MFDLFPCLRVQASSGQPWGIMIVSRTLHNKRKKGADFFQCGIENSFPLGVGYAYSIWMQLIHLADSWWYFLVGPVVVTVTGAEAISNIYM